MDVSRSRSLQKIACLKPTICQKAPIFWTLGGNTTFSNLPNFPPLSDFYYLLPALMLVWSIFLDWNIKTFGPFKMNAFQGQPSLIHDTKLVATLVYVQVMCFCQSKSTSSKLKWAGCFYCTLKSSQYTKVNQKNLS